MDDDGAIRQLLQETQRLIPDACERLEIRRYSPGSLRHESGLLRYGIEICCTIVAAEDGSSHMGIPGRYAAAHAPVRLISGLVMNQWNVFGRRDHLSEALPAF